MKNVKNVTVMLALAAVIAMTMTACPTGDGTTTTATPTQIGYIEAGGTKVPIYQTKGVTSEQAEAVKKDIATVWPNIIDKEIIIGRILKIQIVSGSDITNTIVDGKYIVNIGHSAGMGNIHSHLETEIK